MPKACLIVPCYNESRRLPLEAYRRFLETHVHTDLLFVNDGSSDNTYHVLEHFSNSMPGRIHLLNLAENRGKAEAVRQGMLSAVQSPSWDFIGFLDADLATPLPELQRMTEILFRNPGLQMVFGSRFQRLGVRIRRKIVRHYLGRVFATFASLSLGLPVYDTQCGAKVFRKPFAAELFRDTFISRWLFDVELFFRARNRIGREACFRNLLEVPLEQWEEKKGSRVNPFDFLKAPADLLRIHFHYRKQR